MQTVPNPNQFTQARLGFKTRSTRTMNRPSGCGELGVQGDQGGLLGQCLHQPHCCLAMEVHELLL